MTSVLNLRLRTAIALGLVLLALAAMSSRTTANAADVARLAVVKPVMSCDRLAQARVGAAVDGAVTITSAAVMQTSKGAFCVVSGNIAPAIGFRVDLPVDHWTQRYFQGGCGGLCGRLMIGLEHASDCLPALNGEFVVAGDDMGHQSSGPGPNEGAFAADMQKRIDFAYRGNHVTALVAKALIKIFYGRAPRYAYFVGCSDGGREALIEAQRYPADFNGIAAGDPAAMFVMQNSFYHAWNALSDKRPDGSNILSAAKMHLVHDAVIAHCDTLSGVKDGLLVDPSACDFDPASIACPPGSTDVAKCLTADELRAVRAQYSGAIDGKGHSFTFGAQKGGEAQWVQSLPTGANDNSMSMGMATSSIQGLILPQVDTSYDVAKFQFTEATFNQMVQTAPLYDATNTDLKPYAAHGGKIILYHGVSDTSITPGIAIAYYEGVQAFVGRAATDTFLRLFMIPGMWHCRGGDGYDQFDLLSPLIAWTELHHAPAALITGKTTMAQQGFGGPGGPRGGPGGPPRMGAVKDNPVASPPPTLVATRPAYPYPYIPRYTGSGDANDAANYRPVMSPAGEQKFPATDEALKLIGPDNQVFYHVVNNIMVPTP